MDDERDDCRAASAVHLRSLLEMDKPYIFSLNGANEVIATRVVSVGLENGEI